MTLQGNQPNKKNHTDGELHQAEKHHVEIRRLLRSLKRRERMVPLMVMSGTVGIAIVLGLIALALTKPKTYTPLPLSMRDNYTVIPREQLGYLQTDEIHVDLERLTSLATDEANQVYVGGDQMILVFGPDGKQIRSFSLDGEPRCLAVAGAGHDFPQRIYVGMKDHVEVLSPDGQSVAVWDSLGEDSVITSIAIGPMVIFVADAGRRTVHCFDTEGRSLGELDREEDTSGLTSFLVPSPYFDMAISPIDGLLRVVNPGMHRIEAYTMEGRREKPLNWGQPGFGLDSFCGCCNPTSLDVLPDGRFVTAEKFVLRVKVYNQQGQYQTVVAGPQQLDTDRRTFTPEPLDPKRSVKVAADRNGRILVLDPLHEAVRIFESIQSVENVAA